MKKISKVLKNLLGSLINWAHKFLKEHQKILRGLERVSPNSLKHSFGSFIKNNPKTP